MKSSKITLAFALAIAVAALVLPLKSVAAADQVPIKGSSANSDLITVNFPFVHISSDGVGQISHLGRTTIHSEINIFLLDGAATGTVTFTAANGDTLTGTNSGIIPPPDPQGNTEADLAVTFTGGTGRFSDASGSAITHVVSHPTGPNTAVSFATTRGTVSSVGSN